MRKITFILVVGLLSLFAESAKAGNYGNGNLGTILTNCTDGEIIVLTGDTYTWSAKISTFTKSATVKADPSLTTRPVVTLPAGVALTHTGTVLKTITYDGIDFNGNAVATGLISGKCATGGNLQITINNCLIRNIAASTVMFAYTAVSGLASYGDLTVTNSKFIGPFKNFLTAATATVSPNNINLKNCFISGGGTTTANGIVINETLSGINSITIDHCTFTATTGNKNEMSINSGITTLVKNTLFINNTCTANNTFGAINASNINNTVYNNSGVAATRYPNLGTISTSDPTLSGDYSTTPVGLGYYNASTINQSSTLSAFNYAEGSVTSTAQTFTVSGTDLFNNLTVTAPSNYEVSLNDETYSGSVVLSPTLGTVSNTTVYIRLALGNTAASSPYNGNITLTSTNATQVNIACTGTVNAGGSPTIVATGSPLSGFNYLYDNGPSASQSFSVSGSNLSAGITVTPSPNYEVSLDNSTFSSSAIVIGSGPTVTSTLVYVHLKAGLNGGSYNSESIGLTSGEATQQNVICSGTVTPPTLNLTPTSLSSFFALAGSSSPSSEKSFIVSGSNLAGNITITASTNYEISTGTVGSFIATSPITILQANAGSPTTIYVRLKGSLATASYAENITVATAGASNATVACTGVVATPIIKVGNSAGLDNKFALTPVSYTYNNGPSGSLSGMYVSGDYLQSDVTATAPTNFEISKDNSAFADFVTFTMTNQTVSGQIWVRLKAGLNTDTYSGNIVFSSTSAPNRNVAPSGSVTSGPQLTTGVLTGTSFNYAGNGPGAERTFPLSGTNMGSDVTISPSANFEVSLTTVSGFSSSPITVLQADVTSGTTIYVRMKAGIVPNTYSETLTLSATNANTRSVSVSGTVTSLITLSSTSKTGVDYAGNGPSPEYSFTVSGTNMAGAITVTPPADYEVSTTSGTGYTLSPFTLSPSSGAISQMLYFRLKAGLAPAVYSGEIIALSAATATTKNFTCSGTVSSATTTSVNTLSGINYSGNGPSTESTFTVSGANLVGSITVTPAVSGNYEISATSGSGFGTIPIILTPTSGNVTTTTIYVRLKAGLGVASYNLENIVVSTSGIADKNVACSGTVSLATPVISSFTPTTATNGASVVITGFNFTGASAVSFGATAATSFVVDSDTQITAVVAAGTTGSVSVTTGIGTGTLAGFSYTNNQTIASTASASALTLTPTSDVTVANGGTLTIDQATSINSITIERGGRVSNSSTLTVPTFTINSDANGTGTYVDNGTTTVSGTTTVNQYVTSTATGVAGRNWYISSPVSAALSSTITNATGNGLVYYAGGSSWLDAGTTMDVMKGYIAKSPAQITTIAFSGGTLNTGPQSVSDLPLGFNLVGNPYPSYLNWTDATKTNISTSIWYRSKSTGSYLFQTYNVAGDGVSVNNGTELIPPMQSFWIKTTSSTNTLGFTNNMRSHQDQSIATNRLKSPKASTQQLLRLQVSNGTNRDEAVVYFNENAQNTLDTFDSQKMFNNITEVPEIYTQIGADKLVINGMSAIPYDIEIPVGFNTLQSNNFSISATELKNFDSDTKIILKDNLLKTEKDITNGQSYEFSSDVANNISRFSIQFKSASLVSGNDYLADDFSNITIYKNENNLITINCSSAIVANGIVTVCNSVGQKMINSRITSTNSVINTPLKSGVYLVNVSAAGNTTTKKLIIN